MKKTKNIFKEVFIVLFICVAIALVLMIILYGYNPSNKIVPSKISYTTPENVKQEIVSSGEETTTPVTITYELDETNIDNSRKSGSYNSGRQNPFADIQQEAEATTQTTEDSGNTNSKTNENTSSKNSSTDSANSSKQTNETHYLPDTGTK